MSKEISNQTTAKNMPFINTREKYSVKRVSIACGTVILTLVFLMCALIIPRSDIGNAEVVISSDYSNITYKDEIHVPIQPKELPLEVMQIKTTVAADMIKATVEDENYFFG